jgi:hypothetical protein
MEQCWGLKHHPAFETLSWNTGCGGGVKNYHLVVDSFFTEWL